MGSTRGTRSETNPLVLLVLSILLLFISSGEIMKSSHLKSVCTSTVTGSVQYVLLGGSRNTRNKYTATVYYSVNDARYSVRTAASSHHFSHGESVRVNYNPGNPKEAFCPDYSNHSGVTLLLGLIAFVIGAWLIYRERTHNKADVIDDDFYY